MINDDFLCLQEEINQATRATLGPPAEMRTNLGQAPQENYERICPHCGSRLLIRMDPDLPYMKSQICPVCGEVVGTGYTLSIITELPWPIYTKKSITCSKCATELELTISSLPSENLSQVCPVCGAPAD